MTGRRRPATTPLGALAFTLPLLCAAVVSANSHDETTPSTPPSRSPSPNPSPKPIMPPTIELIQAGFDCEQTTRCATQIDI
jgi:hypothetical protein